MSKWVIVEKENYNAVHAYTWSEDRCKEWIEKAGFRLIRDIDISSCCRYHFGIVAIR